MVLMGACTDQQPTEASRASEPVAPSWLAAGVLRDDFTDVDGTLLHNHTPDGGTEPFSWLQAVSWGLPEAVIQDNAVIARVDMGWAYVTSEPTGDWAELTVDVFGDADATGVGQDIVMWMRTADANHHDGFEVYWSIGPGVNTVAVHGRDIPSGIYHSPSAVTPGLHTFRAEISAAGAMHVSIDGTLLLTHHLGSLPPPNRTGLGFWTNGPPTVRLTSFAAGTPGALSLNVVCTPATRGDATTCTASAADTAVQVDVDEWRFDGAEIVGPIIEATSSTTWSGIAATSGRVRVKGTLNGAGAAGDDTLIVLARNWNQDTVAYRVVDVPVTGLPAHPTRVGELGNHQALAGGYLPPSGFQQISAGPNKGVFYFTKVPVSAESEVRINRVALALNSDFYLLQPKNVPNHSPSCSRKDVLPFLPLVEAHEGLTLADSSHAGVFRRELNLQVPQATEPVVALNDVSLLQGKADAAAQPGILSASNKARDQINGGVVPPVPYCAFRYFPNP